MSIVYYATHLDELLINLFTTLRPWVTVTRLSKQGIETLCLVHNPTFNLKVHITH